jgi:hypothetical protein
MVTWENYEEYMMLHVDGELKEAESQALLAFVRQHPELQEELRMYQASVLLPEPALTFPGKEALLKPAQGGRTISLGNWKAYSAAAAIVFAILVLASRWMRDDRTSETARTTAVVKHETVTPLPEKDNRPLVNPQVSGSVKETPVIRREEGRSIARHSVHSTTKQIAKKSLPSPQTELAALRPVEAAIQQRVPDIESLQPINTHDFIVQEELSAERLAKKQSDVLAWLPEEKQQGLQTLRDNIDQRIEKAKNLKESLRDTHLALKLGNKELFVINF